MPCSWLGDDADEVTNLDGVKSVQLHYDECSFRLDQEIYDFGTVLCPGSNLGGN